MTALAPALNLNARAFKLVETLGARADERRVALHDVEGGGRVVDCGIEARGGLLVGLDLARICLAGLAEVTIVPGEVGGRPCPVVEVVTDHPVAACLASQYAGWHVSEGKYFAMGSGPMRAAYGHEAIFQKVGHREDAPAVVGVLEGRKPPPPGVVAKVAEACRVAPDAVTLLIAPTASLAGGVQVVARVLEVALHKLHELGFPLARVVDGMGTAPLPPPHPDFVTAMGRTNDAIIFGGRVHLYVTGPAAEARSLAEALPASRSRDYGRPFAETFRAAGGDFYAIDKMLFSPAEVIVTALESGASFHAGGLDLAQLDASFG